MCNSARGACGTMGHAPPGRMRYVSTPTICRCSAHADPLPASTLPSRLLSWSRPQSQSQSSVLGGFGQWLVLMRPDEDLKNAVRLTRVPVAERVLTGLCAMQALFAELQKAREDRDQGGDRRLPVMPAAFVTFRTRKAQVGQPMRCCVASSLHSYEIKQGDKGKRQWEACSAARRSSQCTDKDALIPALALSASIAVKSAHAAQPLDHAIGIPCCHSSHCSASERCLRCARLQILPICDGKHL